MSAPTDLPETPPGVLRLLGMIFFQPVTLHRVLAREGLVVARPWTVLRRAMQEPIVAQWLGRWFVLLAATLTLPILVVLLPSALGNGTFGLLAELLFDVLIAGLCIDLILFLLFGFGASLALAAAGTVCVYVFLFSIGEFEVGIAVAGLGLGLVMQTVGHVAADEPPSFEPWWKMVFLACGPVALTIFTDLPLVGAVFSAFVVAGFLRIPFYLFEVPLALWAWRVSRTAPAQAARLLPTRFDEVIFLPLPFLKRTLVAIAEQDPDLGATVIADVEANLGQNQIGLAARCQLQCKAIDRLAADQSWARLEDNPPPFFHPKHLPFPLSLAAECLAAAAHGGMGSQWRRRDLLGQAAAVLQHPGDAFRSQRLLRPVGRRLLLAVEAEQAALDAEPPEVPAAFRADHHRGRDASWFKGRDELATRLRPDPEHQALVVLTGLRGMGKSAFVAQLDRWPDSKWESCTLNFPWLKVGAPWAETAPGFIGKGTWVPSLIDLNLTLRRMVEWDARMEIDAPRPLLIIDDVDALAKGMSEGWIPPEFLHFLRQAGEQLTHIRLLLISHRPLDRLGPEWTTRLAGAIEHRLGPLEPQEAEALLRQPIPDFPDIWPQGAVEQICTACAGHPLLLHSVGHAVVHALNLRGAFKADPTDIERALEGTIRDCPLFLDLWNDCTAPEQALLRRLADGGESGPLPDDERPAATGLQREDLIRETDTGHLIAIPLFAAWIRGWPG